MRPADTLVLVSHPLCPYVQRAAISLAEKGVPFERIDIDLADKPDWFKAISPLGKVPLLRVRQNGDETIIFESAVILEFLEETQANPLPPRRPLCTRPAPRLDRVWLSHPQHHRPVLFSAERGRLPRRSQRAVGNVRPC